MKKQDNKLYVRCPECNKLVTAKVPKGGDGSAWYPWSHGNPKTNEKCNGCYCLVTELEDENE